MKSGAVGYNDHTIVRSGGSVHLLTAQFPLVQRKEARMGVPQYNITFQFYPQTNLPQFQSALYLLLISDKQGLNHPYQV